MPCQSPSSSWRYELRCLSCPHLPRLYLTTGLHNSKTKQSSHGDRFTHIRMHVVRIFIVRNLCLQLMSNWKGTPNDPIQLSYSCNCSSDQVLTRYLDGCHLSWVPELTKTTTNDTRKVSSNGKLLAAGDRLDSINELHFRLSELEYLAHR